MPSSRVRRGAPNVVATMLLAAGAVVMLAPLAWLLITAIQRPLDAFAQPPKFVFTPTLGNFVALGEQDFYASLMNSAVVMVASAVLSLAFGVPAGYALSRARFRGSRLLVGWLAFVYATPALIWIIPLFMIFQTTGLLGTRTSLVLFYESAQLPMVIFLMASYFTDLPSSLEEAAAVDGASKWQTLLRVILPSALPGIATVTTLVCIVSWGEYYGALIFSGFDSKTAPVALAEYLGEGASNWSTLAAGGLFVVLPVMVLTVVAQRGYLRRVESTGSTG